MDWPQEPSQLHVRLPRVSFLAQEARRAERTSEVPLPKFDEHEPRLLSVSDQGIVLSLIAANQRGIFLALAHLGLRPNEARALTVADYHDGWISVDKAFKARPSRHPSGAPRAASRKRLPVSAELRTWIEEHVDPTDRLRGAFLFQNPRTGGPWAHKALQTIWRKALEQAEFPPISLYEGTKHSFATDAIRRGVPETSPATVPRSTRPCKQHVATRVSLTTR